MSIQRPFDSHFLYKKREDFRSADIHNSCKTDKKNIILGFFKRLNPANWFNELRDIQITMEEFGGSKR